MAERRFELALQWIEEGKDIPDRVAARLQNLYSGLVRADARLKEFGYTGKQNAVMFQGLQEQYRRNYVETAKGDVGFKLLSDTLDEQAARAEASRKSMEKFGRNLRNIGIRLGWLGYRLSIVGRMLLRWTMQPINKVIGVLKDWDKTLVDTAMTLGLLEATGMGSATTLASLRDILEKLPEVGLKFQAAMGALEAMWTRIAVDVGPVLTDVIMALADAFFKVWDAVSPALIQVLETLKDSILPPLIDLIEKVGPAFLINLVEGAGFTVGALTTLLEVMEPFIPTIGWIIGAILPLAPVLVLVGTAAYLLSPIFMTLGSIITFLASGALMPLLTALGMVAVAVTAGVLVFMALRDILGPTLAAIAAICTAVAVGVGLWYLFSSAIVTTTAAGAAATPVIGAVGAAFASTLVAMIPAIPVILALAVAALAVGAAFLMAGVGVNLACQGLIALLTALTTLYPMIPYLFTCAAGLMAIAVAGWALIPAMFGLIGAAAGLFALAAGIIALTAAIWGLVAAAKAFEAVGGTVKDIVGGLSDAVGWLGGALSSLCFRHAIPMAEEFGKVLTETAQETQSLDRDVLALGDSLRAIRPGTVGIGGEIGAGEGTQYITVYPEIHIGSVSSTIDLEQVTNSVNRGIAESLRRRR